MIFRKEEEFAGVCDEAKPAHRWAGCATVTCQDGTHPAAKGMRLITANRSRQLSGHPVWPPVLFTLECISELTMKAKSVVAVFLSTAMSASVYASDIAPMHGGFTGTLGSGHPRMDRLKGVCPLGTSPAVFRVEARVRDLSPVQPPEVRVRVIRLSSDSCAATAACTGTLQGDPVDGDAGFSLFSTCPAANGDAFMIEVDKTQTTNNPAESYELDYHCENGTVNHPVPALTYCQNQ